MKSGRHWPFLIVGLLVLNVGANAALFVAGNSDRSFAVEKDYDVRARNFERELAQRQLNSDLGWNITFDLRHEGTLPAGAKISARLEDPRRVPVPDAACTVEAYHNARAALRQKIALRASGDTLGGDLNVDRAGIWEFDFVCDASDVHFTQSARRELGVGATTGGAAP